MKTLIDLFLFSEAAGEAASPAEAPEIIAPAAAPEEEDGADEDLAADFSAHFKARSAAFARDIRATREFYPAFDLEREMQSPRFLHLLDAGLSVRESYEVLHRDELLRQAVDAAHAHAREEMARQRERRTARPRELSAGFAAVTKKDPAKMSRSQREDISRRVLRGEKVTF